MALIDSLIVFLVSLLIGALGLYVGARVITGVDDYSHAIVTALIGAIVWGLSAWIPLIGPIIALVAYVAIINWRYPEGWLSAIGIALVAWVTVFVVLYVLAVLNVTTFEAVGVPGM